MPRVRSIPNALSRPVTPPRRPQPPRMSPPATRHSSSSALAAPVAGSIARSTFAFVPSFLPQPSGLFPRSRHVVPSGMVTAPAPLVMPGVRQPAPPRPVAPAPAPTPAPPALPAAPAARRRPPLLLGE
jgi:hypothetical protein